MTDKLQPPRIATEHTVTVTVDPDFSAVIATPMGVTIPLDMLPGQSEDAERVGRALLAWVRTARRIRLGELAVERTDRPTSGDSTLSLLDDDVDGGKP